MVVLMVEVSGGRHGAKIGALIGAVGGLVFVLVNAGSASGPWPPVLRIAGAVVFLLAVVLVVRAPDLSPEQHRTRTQMRAYGWIVLAEVLAIPIGASVLTNVLGLDGASLPWVVIVLGVHFIGFEWVFPRAGFLSLGVVLSVIGVVTLVLAIAGADRDLVIVLAGVVPGFVLLAGVLRGVASGLGTRSTG